MQYDETEDSGAGERAGIYRFLASAFFSAPTRESMATVTEMSRMLEVSCPENLSPDELQREFMDLFVVPNPRYVAPYESVYRDRWQLPMVREADGSRKSIGRLLMGESTMAVRQCFLEAGVLPQGDLPDHIGNELRLMAHLCDDGNSEKNGSDRRKNVKTLLCQEHLLKWVELLTRKVSENEKYGFYSAVLNLAALFLRSEVYADVPGSHRFAAEAERAQA